jgi:hypothetical protein
MIYQLLRALDAMDGGDEFATGNPPSEGPSSAPLVSAPTNGPAVNIGIPPLQLSPISYTPGAVH